MDDKLNLDMFLSMIPNLMPCGDQSDCLRKLNVPSYDQTSLNGEMPYTDIYSKPGFENSSINEDLCVHINVDNSSETDLKIDTLSPNKVPDVSEETTETSKTIQTVMKRKQITQECRSLKVICLQSADSLKRVCEEQGLVYNEPSESDSTHVYEVDMICDHRIEDDERYFFIKWKNYPLSTNTWEPECHLSGCHQAISFYLAIQRPDMKLNKHLVEFFIQDITSRKPYDVLSLIKLCALSTNSSEIYVDSLKLNLVQLKRKVKELLNFPSNKFGVKLVEIMKFSEKRKHLLINLQEWEDQINSQNTTAYIQVENNVDFETAPTDFHFIHDYINRAVNIPEEPVTFCCCEDCYKSKIDCCPQNSEGLFAYSRHRRLLLQPGYPIYECNKRCACDSTCTNRVVQHGQKVKVAIFRTSNGCGWGLKSLETIEKGQFVLEYLGEIITSEEAEIRGHDYDYIGRSYLFDLDYSTDNCFYTVDAGIYGNAAHFINHSCDPNLHVFAVWINQPDPNLPRLAFFAKRKIKRGEELTFDYKMVKKDRFSADAPQPEKRIPCLCQARNCRKFLF